MDYATAFVSEFCNQLAINERGLRQMCAWYIFEDDRPGTVVERFEQDARVWFQWSKMFANE